MVLLYLMLYFWVRKRLTVPPFLLKIVFPPGKLCTQTLASEYYGTLQSKQIKCCLKYANSGLSPIWWPICSTAVIRYLSLIPS